MPAYFLFDNVEVRDPDALTGYAKQASETVAEYGGRYLAANVVPEVVEGDPGHQPLKAIRHRAVQNNAVLIQGF